jgi:hypothetical protein
MIYEWRIYEVVPGKIDVLNDRFEKVLVNLFEKNGIKVVGFWQAIIGRPVHVLYYMLAFEDLAHRERAWNSFFSDPEFKKWRADLGDEFPITTKITNMILKPTRYSPMQ